MKRSTEFLVRDVVTCDPDDCMNTVPFFCPRLVRLFDLVGMDVRVEVTKHCLRNPGASEREFRANGVVRLVVSPGLFRAGDLDMAGTFMGTGELRFDLLFWRYGALDPFRLGQLERVCKGFKDQSVCVRQVVVHPKRKVVGHGFVCSSCDSETEIISELFSLDAAGCLVPRPDWLERYRVFVIDILGVYSGRVRVPMPFRQPPCGLFTRVRIDFDERQPFR